MDSKVAYGKDIGSGKASRKKVSGFLADFVTRPYRDATVGL